MATLPTILIAECGDDLVSKIESLIRAQPELSFQKTIGREEALSEFAGASGTLVWLELESDPDPGLVLLRKLVDANPNSYFIVSKNELEPDLVKKSMQAGALDFLDHKGWGAQVRSVIRRIAAKEWGVKQSPGNMAASIPRKSGGKPSWSIARTAEPDPPASPPEPKSEPPVIKESKPEPEVKIPASPEPQKKAISAPPELKPRPAKPQPQPEPEPVKSTPEPEARKELDSAPGTEKPPEAKQPADLEARSSLADDYDDEITEEEVKIDKSQLEARPKSAPSSSPKSSGLAIPALSRSKWEELDSIISTKKTDQLDTEEVQPEITKTQAEPLEGWVKEVENILDDTFPSDEEIAHSEVESAESEDQQADYEASSADSKSKWGDLDSIGTSAAESVISDFQESSSQGNDLPVSKSKSKWGDLDALGTPAASAGKSAETKENSDSELPVSKSSSKWGDLDKLGTSSSFKSEPAEPKNKWGDLDKIGNPASTDDGAISSAPSKSKWGDLESIGAPMDNLDSPSEPAAPRNWDDLGLGVQGSSSSTAPTEKSIESFLSGGAANDAAKSADQLSEKEAEEERVRHLPTPQAQAPNKWTSSEKDGTASVLKEIGHIRGTVKKPKEKKPIKISISISWNVARLILAAIAVTMLTVSTGALFMY